MQNLLESLGSTQEGEVQTRWETGEERKGRGDRLRRAGGGAAVIRTGVGRWRRGAEKGGGESRMTVGDAGTEGRAPGSPL